MQIVDLTLPVPNDAVQVKELQLPRPGGFYTGIVYRFEHSSMVGTYIDFPGHIKETDDGLDAANYPLKRLYRVESAVIRLNRASGSGGIEAEELKDACRTGFGFGCIVLNALGTKRFDEVATRSVWLAKSAVEWIISTGAHLLVSDVYERAPEPLGVFFELFAAGISTVCCPINLHLLDAPRARITALPARFATATQVPCRVVAEIE